MPAYQHAAELRRRGIFKEVREAFWKQEPFVGEVVASLEAARVFIVPLFVSEGYFSEEVIPRELGFRPEREGPWARIQRRGTQTLFYCASVGSHDSMTELLLARADEALRESIAGVKIPPPTETALFIAGHGTPRNENSRRSIERQVERIRARGIYAEVHGVYMEEEPRINDCYELAPPHNFVVVPFFISDGMHSFEDIPVLLGERSETVRERRQKGEPAWINPTERHGKRVWYARSVGTAPRLADLILQRVREAAAITLEYREKCG